MFIKIWERFDLRCRQRRSSLVTSLRTSDSVYSSSANYSPTHTATIRLKSCVVMLLIDAGREATEGCSTLSIVSASAPSSFSQSVSCLSGSRSAGMWKIEGGEKSVWKIIRNSEIIHKKDLVTGNLTMNQNHCYKLFLGHLFDLFPFQSNYENNDCICKHNCNLISPTSSFHRLRLG